MCTNTFLLNLDRASLDSCEGASFLQSAFWGRFKARFGWEAHAFSAGWLGAPAGNPALPLLVLSRPLVRGIGFAYAPWGPELPADLAAPSARTQALAELARGLRRNLPRNTAFIRFDPPWHILEGQGGGQGALFLQRPFSRAAVDVQPPDTVLVDLDQGDEALLAAMKEKCRYNIRLSMKKGVAVRRCDEAGLGVFYRLLEETAKRDGIAIHSRDYYGTLFALAKDDSRVEMRLYIAACGGEDLAAIITLFRGEEAVYLYGASSDSRRNLMAPHLLQWTVIRDARAFGCRRYDLFGIPPDGDPSHPMAGLYRFKTGFGGRIIHRGGSWDFSYRPLARALFSLAESLRGNLRARKKRRA